MLWRPAVAFAEPPPAVEFADPAHCPVTAAERFDVSPVAADATTGRSDIQLPKALPQGSPAPPALERDITRVVDAFFACVATHDPARIYPFFSAAVMQRRGLARPPAALQAPEPNPVATITGPPTPYAEPWHIQVLPDGRVAALIWMASDDPNPAPGKTLLWILTNEGGGWRIDEIVDQIAPCDSKFPIYVADLVDLAFPATPGPTLEP
ncbi:MAG TPA: hypothetical protein VFU81_23650 [Thermomicrobiales bacterium]|nr:hypothetical protein [Thermomicrobiales bacterium]